MCTGRLTEARKALQKLRGKEYNIELEFSKLTRSYEVTKTDKHHSGIIADILENFYLF